MASCDQDPFGAAYRHIGGRFYLNCWEDFTTYYVVDPQSGREEDTGGGAIGGTVEMIGWNDNFIAVKRHANFGGDPDGWMVLDIATGEVTGPRPNGSLDNEEDLAGIKIMKPAEAWDALGGSDR